MLVLLAHTGFILLAPALWTVSAQQLLAWLERRFSLGAELSTQGAFNFGLGLLLYINCALLLLLAGAPWPVATYVPLLPGFFLKERLKFILNWKHLEPGLNLILWFTVVLISGVTLLQTHAGIATAWRNNYGDLAFHIGMLTSFIWGDNMPPQFHLFAGERMSYPFLINLWTALWWWPADTWRYLGFIFTYQWVLLWMLLYYLVQGNRWPILPWLMLLGGGSLTAVGNNSGALIETNIPWTSFLTTIWVTQRSALLGICMLTLALPVLVRAIRTIRTGSEDPKTQQFQIAVASATAGMSVLAHTHLFLILALFSLFYVLASVSLAHNRGRFLKHCCFAAIPGGISLLYLPWILSKTPWVGDASQKGMGHFMLGWGTGIGAKELSGLDRASTTFVMWADAAAPLFLVVLATLVLSKRFIELAVLLLLFIGANCLQLCYWEWDQIKLFVGIYAIFISLWSLEESPREVVHTLAVYGIAAIALVAMLSPTLQTHLPSNLKPALTSLSAITGALGRSPIFMCGILGAVLALLLLTLARFATHVLWYYQVLALPLLIPSLVEAIQVLAKQEQFTVYTTEQITQAEKLRLHTEPRAILQAAPNHNSAVTLAGRVLFYGYEGTLSSHGLDYQKRKSIAHNLSEMATCRKNFTTPELCPQYLFYEPQDTWWRGGVAPTSLQTFQRTPGLEGLYTIR